MEKATDPDHDKKADNNATQPTDPDHDKKADNNAAQPTDLDHDKSTAVPTVSIKKDEPQKDMLTLDPNLVKYI